MSDWRGVAEFSKRGDIMIQTVGVLGCGLMGSGIAQVCAMSGYYTTIVREVSGEMLAKGIASIDASLEKLVVKGKMTAEVKRLALGSIDVTTHLQDLGACDIIIEAIIENFEEKVKVFQALDGIVGEHTIFASNTSSLPITNMSLTTKRGDRFIGLHFFNPVPIMKLVEVIRGGMTSDETYQTVMAFAKSLGKEPITAPDQPGFIVNRLLVPYLLDAIRMLGQCLATAEDIDKGMTLGCGYPMGPLTLLDYVGLDTTLYIANIMFEKTGDQRFKPPELLERMVAEGRLGKKSGRGFYDYSKA